MRLHPTPPLPRPPFIGSHGGTRGEGAGREGKGLDKGRTVVLFFTTRFAHRAETSRPARRRRRAPGSAQARPPSASARGDRPTERGAARRPHPPPRWRVASLLDAALRLAGRRGWRSASSSSLLVRPGPRGARRGERGVGWGGAERTGRAQPPTAAWRRRAIPVAPRLPSLCSRPKGILIAAGRSTASARARCSSRRARGPPLGPRRARARARRIGEHARSRAR